MNNKRKMKKKILITQGKKKPSMILWLNSEKCFIICSFTIHALNIYFVHAAVGRQTYSGIKRNSW
jgi:hypothetical protein